MKEKPTAMLVVAGALASGDGRWLMHRRPPAKHHGGLWEFPGGKVEAGEMPKDALVRELREELGIDIDERSIAPAAFAETIGPPAIVILLYTVSVWRGRPRACEGGRIDWFVPAQIVGLSKPPLDCDLVRRLGWGAPAGVAK